MEHPQKVPYLITQLFTHLLEWQSRKNACPYDETYPKESEAWLALSYPERQQQTRTFYSSSFVRVERSGGDSDAAQPLALAVLSVLYSFVEEK